MSDRCEACGHVVEIGDWPFCPHGRAGSAVIGDEIDLIIENNGTSMPMRFRSREALKKHLDAHDLAPMVRHIPAKGSDKSPHTLDWSRGIDPVTLENARVLTMRAAERGSVPASQPLPIELTARTLDSWFVVKMERD
jgi:hypothetical protein